MTTSANEKLSVEEVSDEISSLIKQANEFRKPAISAVSSGQAPEAAFTGQAAYQVSTKHLQMDVAFDVLRSVCELHLYIRAKESTNPVDWIGYHDSRGFHDHVVLVAPVSGLGPVDISVQENGYEGRCNNLFIDDWNEMHFHLLSR